MQSFISHFNQYSLLVDPSRATFPAGFDRGLAIDLKSYDTEFDNTIILETELHENNNISISHPNKQ